MITNGIECYAERMGRKVMGQIPALELKTIEEIKRLSAKKAINMKINVEKKPNITDSKFGGVPYWDLSKEYPKNGHGALLMLLAQINLDELNREGKNIDHKLPKRGMLQFFIDSTDDVYGMDFYDAQDEENPFELEGYRVIYHQTINIGVSEEEIKALGMPVSTDEKIENTPIWGEYGLDIGIKETYIMMDDYRFENYFHEAAKNVGWEINENESFYKQFSGAGRKLLYDQINTSGHWILGYPYFTQFDPRRNEEEWDKTYSIQLLQIDTDGDGTEEFIMWGDGGVANFFINEKDLAHEEFGDILYSWDCC